MKGHALIQSGKWEGHDFFRKKFLKYPGPPHPHPPIKNVPSLRSSSFNTKLHSSSTRRFHTKATLMYKILNDLSVPQLSNSFVKLNDININYNLRNIETDLALPRPYTNFLKRSFRYSGAKLWNNLSYEAKTAQSLADFNHKLASSPSMPSTGSH